MPNRLVNETSPYLQQHADNPVDWYPWGEEALSRAREENKPILLSIGYSACHWCHVMAHESFEDPQIAEVMNRHFVNIKVDREERPDIDQIYQIAHQLLTRRAGGWPLTMFLAPDQKPFFGGTYFPRDARYHLPGFGALLERIAQIHREQAEAIAGQNDELAKVLSQTVPASPGATIAGDEVIVEALHELDRAFDPEHGGLGDAPKFPHPAELALVLREGTLRGDPAVSRLALFSLERMASGGLYDQLGGGFYRYSTDAHWSIPHFEKMLYDNALLLRLYADAWLVSADPLFERACRGTVQWLLSEMQSAEGAWYSSLDADSEHEEGKFYVWSREEVSALLTQGEYDLVSRHYGLSGPPNFENRAWHLRVVQPLAILAEQSGLTLDRAQALLGGANARLLAARERRVRPGRDDKILTSWNSLMIHGMARAARVFGEPAWLESARRCLRFIRTRLWDGDRLLATCKDGKAHLNAYLDDHAFLLAALLALLEADFDPDDLAFARRLADLLLERFEDRTHGGFYFTSHDHEPLILRPKPGPDNATPSGNGVAAWALQRLGHVTGDARYLDAAARALRLFTPQLAAQPGGFASLLAALSEHARPTRLVVLRGRPAAMQPWSAALSERYLPDTMVLSVPDGCARLPGALDKPYRPGVNAWVCEGVSCMPPIDALERLIEVLCNSDAGQAQQCAAAIPNDG